MFKTWQIFVFSLVPLALVFAGVIGGSFYGDDSRREVFPPPGTAPVVSPTPRAMTSDATTPRLIIVDARGATLAGRDF